MFVNQSLLNISLLKKIDNKYKMGCVAARK